MSDPNAAKSGGGFWATALIVIGILWMTLTGLCTASVVVSAALGGDQLGLLQSMPMLLIIAVICIGPGWLIWQGGRALRRRRNNLNG